MPIRAEHVRNLHVGWAAAGSRMILGYDDEEVKHSVKMREAFEYAKTRHLRPHEEPKHLKTNKTSSPVANVTSCNARDT